MFVDKDGSSMSFKLPKDEYMKMHYNDFLEVIHQNLYYGEWCEYEKWEVY